MKRSTVVVVMIGVLVGGVPGVSAQTLSEGTRVRVTRQLDESTGSTISVKAGEEYKLVPEQITGTVVRLNDDEIVITWDGRPVRVPLDHVLRLELSGGRKSRARGAGIGLVIGAVVGGVLGASSAAESGVTTTKGAASWGAFLGLVGALAGALPEPGERWEEVERGQRISLDLILPERGIGAQVSVGW